MLSTTQSFVESSTLQTFSTEICIWSNDSFNLHTAAIKSRVSRIKEPRSNENFQRRNDSNPRICRTNGNRGRSIEEIRSGASRKKVDPSIDSIPRFPRTSSTRQFILICSNHPARSPFGSRFESATVRSMYRVHPNWRENGPLWPGHNGAVSSVLPRVPSRNIITH